MIEVLRILFDKLVKLVELCSLYEVSESEYSAEKIRV